MVPPSQRPAAAFGRRAFITASVVVGAAVLVAPGASAASAVVTHGTNPDVARPSADVVTWVGSVRPQRAVDGDLWRLA